MKMIEGMKGMVLNNKIIVTGENADEFLNYFNETTDMVNSASND